MKISLIISVLFLSLNAWSVTGANLIAARDAAIEEASFEIDLDTVTAFEVTPLNEEIEVSFKDEKEVHVFGCHFHGNSMACHEEGDDHKALKSQEGFDHIEEGHTAGLEKLEKTLRRRGSDLNVLKSIKVWKLSSTDSGDDGHEHGADVWTKVNYDMSGKEVIVFIQCHEHEEKEEGFACHYKRKGKGEPTL